MARWKGDRKNQHAIYAAVEQVKTNCLINDGSVFTDENLWTSKGFSQLMDHFVNNPKVFDKGKFLDKLENQLKPTDSVTKKLAAELIWFTQLTPIRRDIYSEYKRERIETIWNWSGDEFKSESEFLSNAVLDGIGSGNPAYNAGYWRELAYTIRILDAIKKLETNRREDLFKNPWQFTEWLDKQNESKTRQFRLMLLHLLWPDYFESVFSNSQRMNILIGFKRKTKSELNQMTNLQIDQELLDLRNDLSAEYRNKELDFFTSPLIERWRSESPKKEIVETKPSPPYIIPIDNPVNQILYGPPGTGKTYATTNLALKILDPDFFRSNHEDRELTKDRYVEYEADDRIEFVTFHQSFCYEDFVEGLKAEAVEEGGIKFKVEDGIFKRSCERCGDGKDRVLIIDEINRGNISSIFGELITLIEPSKRMGADEELTVTLPYSKETFAVPSNLYIIGTMNTADRSLVQVDTALRRRFRFVEMMPDTDLLEGIDVDDVNVKLMLEVMNKRIELLYDREHTLGHSFFLPLKTDPTIDRLARIFSHEILPLLEEYFFEDWGRIQQVLGDNQKSGDNLRFYRQKYKGDEVEKLLGRVEKIQGGTMSDGDGGFQVTPYERNDNALTSPAAYIGIYETSTTIKEEGVNHDKIDGSNEPDEAEVKDKGGNN